MDTDLLRYYREVWCVDYEFRASGGSRPTPVCLVARELRSGRLLRVWADELHRLTAPPYPLGPDVLFVAYYASAELGCHLALGWPLPARVLDLYAEFRSLTSGLPTPCGSGLLGALAYHGLDGIDANEKDAMRDLILRRGEYDDGDRRAILDYCQSDVDALAVLLPAMLPRIDLPRALFRGRYMCAVAKMEHHGIPIDTDTLGALRSNWAAIQTNLIRKIDADYGVYEGRSFKVERWAGWLAAKGIPWPRLFSGALALDDDTFKEMARSYPLVAPMRELRASLSALKLNELAVGPDGRNRVMLSPFDSKTGRNQPSNSRFIFGPSAWLRSLIQPTPGRAVAYIDWSQQELAIAAALSGDQKMQDAYASGDFYLTFAKMAGAVPQDATKKSHPAQREQFKTLFTSKSLLDEDSQESTLARPRRPSLRRGRANLGFSLHDLFFQDVLFLIQKFRDGTTHRDSSLRVSQVEALSVLHDGTIGQARPEALFGPATFGVPPLYKLRDDPLENDSGLGFCSSVITDQNLALFHPPDNPIRLDVHEPFFNVGNNAVVGGAVLIEFMLRRAVEGEGQIGIQRRRLLDELGWWPVSAFAFDHEAIILVVNWHISSATASWPHPEMVVVLHRPPGFRNQVNHKFSCVWPFGDALGTLLQAHLEALQRSSGSSNHQGEITDV